MYSIISVKSCDQESSHAVSSRTKNLDFRGFDSSGFLRSGIPRSVGFYGFLVCETSRRRTVSFRNFVFVFAA